MIPWRDARVHVVIPHHRRREHLGRCLASIEASAIATGIRPTVWVVDSDAPLEFNGLKVHWITVPPTEPYNKAKSLNAGIDACSTCADVVAFLDCDMLVGPHWLRAVKAAANPRVHRVAFAVRNIDADEAPNWSDCAYDNHHHRFEAWDVPWASSSGGRRPRGKVCTAYGCSCWASRPAVFGDLRYDERYEGRSYEDLDFSTRIFNRVGRFEWVGLLFRRAHFNLYHIEHELGTWGKNPDYVSRGHCLWMKLLKETQ